MRWLFISLLTFAGAAQAEVYRCKVGDQTVFSDAPCAKDARPVQLPNINVVPKEEVVAPKRKLPVPAVTAAQSPQPAAPATLPSAPAAQTPARKKPESEWAKKHKTKTQKEERVRKGRAERKVVNGMSAKQVRDILGKPDSVTRDDKSGANKERWTYHNADGVQTVRFRNGEVDSTTQKTTEKN